MVEVETGAREHGAARASIAGCEVLAFLELRQEYRMRIHFAFSGNLEAGGGLFIVSLLMPLERGGIICALCGAAKSS